MKPLFGAILLSALTLHMDRGIQYAVLSESVATDCLQSKTQQSSWAQRAQNRKYTLRRLELIGNEHINDHELRTRVLLREGDIFTRKRLIQSMTSVNKLKMIYPITLNDVLVKLDDEDKTIDITICVKEKPPASITETL